MSARRWRAGLEPYRRHLGRSRRSRRWRRRAVRRAPSRRSAQAAPATTIEVLTPDFLKKDGALEQVVAAAARRLQPQSRNRAAALCRAFGRARAISIRCACSIGSKQLAPAMFTKSGLMVGLGEETGGSAAGDGRSARGECRFPHHRPISPADAEASRRRALRHAAEFETYRSMTPSARAFSWSRLRR